MKGTNNSSSQRATAILASARPSKAFDDHEDEEFQDGNPLEFNRDMSLEPEREISGLEKRYYIRALSCLF